LPWEIDPQFRVLSLREFQQPGTRRVEILVKNHGWFPQPGLQEYVWLAGDFALEMNTDWPHLRTVRGIRIGPWEDQGFPCFSGTGAYYATLVLPEDAQGKRMFIDAGTVGNLLEVEINGQDVGVRPWPPYRVEVTHALRPGPNTVVLKVTNTLRNLLEGPDDRHPSGLLEEVWLEIG